MCIFLVELMTKKQPIIYGAPPPPGSHSKHAKRTFVDGTYNYLGELRLVDHVATRVMKQPNKHI